RRQRIEAPGLERHLLERAFGQDIVGVVMSVDEAGQNEMPARFELIDRCAGNLGKARRNAGDLRARNRDIDHRWRMPVAGGTHGGAAADDQRGPGWNRLRAHLTGIRSSRGGRNRSSYMSVTRGNRSRPNALPTWPMFAMRR